ncbi:MAG: acyl-CoA reductase [Bacteroidia bacterium]|nr:acyl-CoA reductase [Bacteroidia bacterium]
MKFEQIINTFTQLGLFLKKEIDNNPPVFQQAYVNNNWFTIEYTNKAIKAWADELSANNIKQWLMPYENIPAPSSQKTIAIIMAGNIPLVGLHDLLAVLAAGHKALIKLSSDDTVLMKWIINALVSISPELISRIEITDERLPKNFDAVIATGSNNTNRYFSYYFKDKPVVLRKARTSVAIITGNETPDDLYKLGLDIFTYFGLGCRNVSKVFIPKEYDLGILYEGIADFYEHINHHKYANNYTYHKAILLMNLTEHLDNNFILFKQDKNLFSPLGVLYYERYNDTNELQALIQNHKNEIQCIVSKSSFNNSIPFGKAQEPGLKDYADGVDTMQFLLSLN